jgi:hypothetical protein
MIEKREHNRVKTHNDLLYVAVDENGKPLERGEGKTLDISQGGLKMVTKRPIKAKYILLMTINLKNEYMRIKGNVVFCVEKKPKAFVTGVRFLDKNEKVRAVIFNMIKVFNQKKALQNSLSNDSGTIKKSKEYTRLK